MVVFFGKIDVLYLQEKPLLEPAISFARLLKLLDKILVIQLIVSDLPGNMQLTVPLSIVYVISRTPLTH